MWQYSDNTTDPNPPLSTPVEIQEQAFAIGVSKGALKITADSDIVHPASVHSTGGLTHPTFPGGVANITLVAKDCGHPPPQPVQVALSPNVVSLSGGHNHAAPALDDVATFDMMTCMTGSQTGTCSIRMTGEGVSSLLKLHAHIDDFDTTDAIVSPVDADEFNMAVAIRSLQNMAFDTSIVFPSGITTTHPENH